MTWVALKMLVGDRTKYFGIIFGVGFSTLLMAQQMSIFCGIMMLTTSQIRDVEGVDLWVMDRDMLSIDDYKPMPDTMRYRVSSIPGVRSAVPFYKGVSLLRKTTSRLEAQKWRPASADSQPTGPLSLVASFLRRARSEEPTVLQQVMLLGVDQKTGLGFPPPEKMLFGTIEALAKPDSVVVDKYSCQLIWREERTS
jgi:putative ABC transport system permease protein